MNNLIDTHFHLDYYRNYREIYDEINILKQYTICVTSSPGVFISCQRLFDDSKSKYVRFALGFHPQNNKLTKKDFIGFKRLLSNTKYVGEVGLDFTSPKYLSKVDQIFYFEEIVKLCSSLNKVMTIHIRKAEDEAIIILRRYMPDKCIIHWYNGSIENLKILIDLGCYFSINTNMIATKNINKKLLIIPKNKILVESDGPFTKVSKGKYNPSLLKKSYELFVEFFDDNNFIEQVFKNFKTLLS